MELVLTKQEVEPFPLKKQEVVHDKPMGFLTSNYKSVVTSNYRNLNRQSLFSKRENAKSYFYNSQCAAEVTLKVSLFLAILLAFFV